MRNRVLATASVLALAVALTLGGNPARGSHWAGSVTDIVDNSTQTQGCHDSAWYFKTQFGWARQCGGGHDIANAPFQYKVYIRGYWWDYATIVNAQARQLFRDQSCPVGQQVAAIEYNNAWQITVPQSLGTIGIGFHHLSNYHYAPNTANSTVPRGYHVADQANWAGLYPLYYCPNNGYAATTGPHIHTEAARDGNPTDAYLVDSWQFAGSGPAYPFIRYEHP